MKIANLIASAILFCTLGANAVEQSHILAAEKLMAVTNTEQVLEHTKPYMDQILTQISSQYEIPENQQAAFDEFLAELKKIMHESLAWDRLKEDYVRIYVNTFTESELHDIIHFYESPAGQMVLERMPKLMEESMSIMPSHMERMLPKLEKLNQDFAERLAAEN